MEDLTENYSKLNLALSVMHECFEPSQDPYTKRDIVEDIIFNKESDLSLLNFRRFYTMLLERDEEVITVSSLRIYSELAEGTILCHKVLKQANSTTQATIPFWGSIKFDGSPVATSTVTQAEDNQPENGASDQELGNVASGDKFLIDVDCMLLDNNEPSFSAWYNEQNFRLIPGFC
ncbi:hypothetical protein DVH24_020604 [Malus domestica]|uniref:Increased DNA methylation 1 C-terminal domain-containing protein n=1 Tax=Malus domestica TaxID=3750 RepID=A0A498JDY8_MALDO|nr:hypothetical protein DVH24_020604 [Malus domestica]